MSSQAPIEMTFLAFDKFIRKSVAGFRLLDRISVFLA